MGEDHARLRYALRVTQLVRETVSTLTFKVEQSVKAGHEGQAHRLPRFCAVSPTNSTTEASVGGSVNRVILVGNLARDPEVRHANDGMLIVTLSVATSERWHDRTTGDRRERTEWHRVVVFNERLGEVAQRYLQKGSKVYLEGQLQTPKWTFLSAAAIVWAGAVASPAGIDRAGSRRRTPATGHARPRPARRRTSRHRRSPCRCSRRSTAGIAR